MAALRQPGVGEQEADGHMGDADAEGKFRGRTLTCLYFSGVLGRAHIWDQLRCDTWPKAPNPVLGAVLPGGATGPRPPAPEARRSKPDPRPTAPRAPQSHFHPAMRCKEH